MIFRDVTPIIYRGSSPTNTGDFKFLRDQGILLILDLQSDEDGIAWRSDKAANLGMQTTSVPMGEILPPSQFDLLVTYGLLVKSSQVPVIKTYVHCRSGVDRTGMVIANFRVRYSGWTKEAALEEMQSNGAHPWLFFWWRYFL